MGLNGLKAAILNMKNGAKELTEKVGQKKE